MPLHGACWLTSGFEPTDFSTRKGGRLEKSSPTNFSNLPCFEVFRAETFKKGWVWEIFSHQFLKPTFFWGFQGWKLQKGVGLRNFCFSNYYIPGAFSSKRRPFIWVWAPLPKRSGVGPGQRVQGSSPTEAQFLKPTLFSGFQGWKLQKGVGLRNLCFFQTTTFPGHFLQKGGLSLELGPRYLTDRALVLASGYKVRVPRKPNFSNLPFFEVFRAESFKKG